MNLLTKEQKALIVSWCQKPLDCFHTENSQNVYKNVSGDEFSISVYDPVKVEDKRRKIICSRTPFKEPIEEQKVCSYEELMSKNCRLLQRRKVQKSVEDHEWW
ncbi:hypothetical protein QE152_g15838 [Popillia japonica]|uniref:Uncharacterized protein n=1 Tax=Popillia japonica TaxID=7064 RepID=A0AAW1L496_POPJA